MTIVGILVDPRDHRARRLHRPQSVGRGRGPIAHALGWHSRAGSPATYLTTIPPWGYRAGMKECPLSDRELEFLQSFADGGGSPRAAQDFGVTVNTVKTHRRNIRRVLGVKSTAAAVAVALRAGWIE